MFFPVAILARAVFAPAPLGLSLRSLRPPALARRIEDIETFLCLSF